MVSLLRRGVSEGWWEAFYREMWLFSFSRITSLSKILLSAEYDLA